MSLPYYGMSFQECVEKAKEDMEHGHIDPIDEDRYVIYLWEKYGEGDERDRRQHSE